MKFDRPPRIVRPLGRAIWAEGVSNAPAQMDTFSLAVGNYGFLVPIGGHLTGAEWCRFIRQTYDCQPGSRNAAVVEAIEQVMLVREFERWTPPSAYQQPAGDLQARLAAILHAQDKARAGVELLTCEQRADAEAINAAMHCLSELHGFNSLVCDGGPSGMRLRKGDQDPARSLTPLTIQDSLDTFGADLAEAGWTPDWNAPLYMVRPAPLINPQGACEFGSLIHPKLIGWRVPGAHTQRAWEKYMRGQESEESAKRELAAGAAREPARERA